MMQIQRRDFIRTASGWALAAPVFGLAGPAWAKPTGKRKFTIELACGPLGVRANLRQTIDFAVGYGFESVEPRGSEVAKMSDTQLKELADELKSKHLGWGVAGVPVNIRAKSEPEFAAQLGRFPAVARALQVTGATRVKTWISPCHDQLTYVQNFKRHADRVRRIAKVAADYGLRFGLEYVGPRTSLNSRRYPFIHTLAETRELIAETGRQNVGLVLDSWHWYTAEETADDLLPLTNTDVVACDLNDAPAGIPVREQIDSRRELPAATGVIDLKSFLGALVHIGYDGPVRCEPFNQPLRSMDDEPAVKTTAAAMKRAFALIG